MLNEKTIPNKFRHTDGRDTEAYTVGELMELLQELPPDLEIVQGFGQGTRVAVAHDMSSDEDILYFDEISEDDNDEE